MLLLVTLFTYQCMVTSLLNSQGGELVSESIIETVHGRPRADKQARMATIQVQSCSLFRMKNTWQCWVDIEHYSVAYFNHVTVLKALYIAQYFR